MAVGTVSGIDLDDNWQLVASQSLSGLNTYTFSSLSAYKTYWLVGKGLTSSGAEITSIRLNGDTSAAAYASAWAMGNNSGQFLVGANSASTRAFSFKVYNADKSIPHKIEATTYDYSGEPRTPGDAYTDPTAITSITVRTYGGGNWTGGTVYLYGIAA